MLVVVTSKHSHSLTNFYLNLFIRHQHMHFLLNTILV